MTDKQIITKSQMIMRIAELSANLEAKEQECERLKEKYLELKEQNGSNIVQLNTVNEQLDQLKAEKETLKQYKASKQASYESMQREWNKAVNENRELKAENEELKHQIEDVDTLCSEKESLIDKYLQTLTEIKEIAEGNCKLCLSVDGFKKPDDCGICEYAKILQKISEVIPNEN